MQWIVKDCQQIERFLSDAQELGVYSQNSVQICSHDWNKPNFLKACVQLVHLFIICTWLVHLCPCECFSSVQHCTLSDKLWNQIHVHNSTTKHYQH